MRRLIWAAVLGALLLGLLLLSRGQSVSYPGATTTPSPPPRPPSLSASISTFGTLKAPTPRPQPADCRGFVRLTFDDGPDATVSPQVLDILKAWNVKATFFLIGQSITGNEALVARQVAEGHRIGNHTWDHPHMTQLSAEQQRLQFQSTTDAIIAAGAARPTEWRPPFDDHNTSLRNLATSMGMSMTLWTYPTDSNDWKGLSSTVIRDRVVSGAVKDSIILQHDRIQNTVTALPLIIDGLYNKGLCIHP